MTKLEQIEHFQTRIHTFSLLMPIGDSHHHTLYIMYASRFKSPEKQTNCNQRENVKTHLFPLATHELKFGCVGQGEGTHTIIPILAAVGILSLQQETLEVPARHRH